jgi:hypothetical protein
VQHLVEAFDANVPPSLRYRPADQGKTLDPDRKRRQAGAHNMFHPCDDLMDVPHDRADGEPEGHHEHDKDR